MGRSPRHWASSMSEETRRRNRRAVRSSFRLRDNRIQRRARLARTCRAPMRPRGFSCLEPIELVRQQQPALWCAYPHIEIAFLQKFPRLLQGGTGCVATQADIAALIATANQILQLRRPIHAGEPPPPSRAGEIAAPSPAARSNRPSEIEACTLLLSRRERSSPSVTDGSRGKGGDAVTLRFGSANSELLKCRTTSASPRCRRNRPLEVQSCAAYPPRLRHAKFRRSGRYFFKPVAMFKHGGRNSEPPNRTYASRPRNGAALSN